MNAYIKEAFLGYEDHNPVLRISCGTGQTVMSTGDISLRGLDFPNTLTLLLRVAGKRQWKDLPGAYVRVKTDERGTISELGHIVDEVYLDLGLTKESVE